MTSDFRSELAEKNDTWWKLVLHIAKINNVQGNLLKIHTSAQKTLEKNTKSISNIVLRGLIQELWLTKLFRQNGIRH